MLILLYYVYVIVCTFYNHVEIYLMYEKWDTTVCIVYQQKLKPQSTEHTRYGKYILPCSTILD